MPTYSMSFKFEAPDDVAARSLSRIAKNHLRMIVFEGESLEPRDRFKFESLYREDTMPKYTHVTNSLEDE